jgi:hypothetical protein
MNESLEQSMTGETGPEQSTELTDRLLRRRTEPAGVINTHHPLQMYDRTAGLVARRFAMLDHWRTRYADAENSAWRKGPTGFDFASTSTPSAALREKAAAAPEISRAAAPEISRAAAPEISRAAAPSASPRSVAPESSARTRAQVPTQAAPTAASPLMRVMRRAARPADAARPSSTPGSHSPIIEGGSRQGSSETPGGTPANSRSIEIDEPAPGDSTPLTLARVDGEVVLAPADTQVQRRQSDDSNSDAGSGGLGKSDDSIRSAITTPASVKGRAGDVATAAIQPSPLQSLPRALPLATPPIAVARAQRKADEAPGLLKGKILGAPASDVATQRAPFPATTSVTERVAGVTDPVGSPGAAQSPSPAREGHMPDQASGQGAEPSSGVSRLPLASASIQRQAAPGETRGPSPGETQSQIREGKGDNSAVASAPQTPGGKPAAAAEIPASSFAQAPPKIVWRKSAESSSTPSPPQSAKRENITPSAPMIARQSDGGSDRTAETFTPASPPAPSGGVGGGVDVEQLAEEVSRLLARQLQIERERRGML